MNKHYGMISAEGNELVDNIVVAARKMRFELDAVKVDVDGFIETNLMRLSVAGYPEATDTSVRELVLDEAYI